MKQVEGIIFTRDLEKLSKALEAKEHIVQEGIYDSRRAKKSGIFKGIAYVYNLIDRVKILLLRFNRAIMLNSQQKVVRRTF